MPRAPEPCVDRCSGKGLATDHGHAHTRRNDGVALGDQQLPEARREIDDLDAMLLAEAPERVRAFQPGVVAKDEAMITSITTGGKAAFPGR